MQKLETQLNTVDTPGITEICGLIRRAKRARPRYTVEKRPLEPRIQQEIEHGKDELGRLARAGSE